MSNQQEKLHDEAAASSNEVLMTESKNHKNKQTKQQLEKSKEQPNQYANSITVRKDEDFSSWYTQVVTQSEMIDYSDVSGCYVIRPWAYFIWETIQAWFDSRIKALGVKNAYFPLFITERALNTEREHVEGFAPEVAWVTRSGTSDLKEPIAIRPTSEVIISQCFARWIRSHRDLPYEVNQWANVIRWEFKDATPFIRSREFLWQEGHTLHASASEAQARVYSILDLYAKVYEELLAIPVIKGTKTELERFAGGVETTTVEIYVPTSGRSIQGATSHHLGQNFGRMFKIHYEDDQGQGNTPYQTSWGLSTRTIGATVMVHGDDRGVILPPRVASIQVILCPIFLKNATNTEELLQYCQEVVELLRHAGVRIEVDSRQQYTPGWKYYYWEMKGVPLRMEIGPRDFSNRQCRLVRRDTQEKVDVAFQELATPVQSLLDSIHQSLYDKAKRERDEHIVEVREWQDFVPALERKCFILTPFCDLAVWEERVKKMSKEELLKGQKEAVTAATSVAAKSLCKPFEAPELPEGTKCFVSGLPAKAWILWGRSY